MVETNHFMPLLFILIVVFADAVLGGGGGGAEAGSNRQKRCESQMPISCAAIFNLCLFLLSSVNLFQIVK
jgi:hypothetical protein